VLSPRQVLHSYRGKSLTHALKRMSYCVTAKHPRAKQQAVFELLCADPCFERVSENVAARSSVKKRLQRARKFAMMVDIFGATILSAVPEVSVTQLDGVRLEELSLWSTGSVEMSKIKMIIGHMAGVEV
jgi:hypothetical protein